MTLPTLLQASVERRLRHYCESQIPFAVRDQLRLGFHIVGEKVTLFEERPSRQKPDEWVETAVAQFRYDAEKREWALFWADRDQHWHPYEAVGPSPTIEELLAEVKSDPAGIFWG